MKEKLMRFVGFISTEKEIVEKTTEIKVKEDSLEILPVTREMYKLVGNLIKLFNEFDKSGKTMLVKHRVRVGQESGIKITEEFRERKVILSKEEIEILKNLVENRRYSYMDETCDEALGLEHIWYRLAGAEPVES